MGPIKWADKVNEMDKLFEFYSKNVSGTCWKVNAVFIGKFDQMIENQDIFCGVMREHLACHVNKTC